MPQSKTDFAPPYPWTGQEPRAATRKEVARRCYIDAMFCHAMAKYETVRGNSSHASTWLEMFTAYRDLVTDFDTIDPDMPLTTIHAPLPCSTPGCDGVWWDTTYAIWLRKKIRTPTPAGQCRRCTEAS